MPMILFSKGAITGIIIFVIAVFPLALSCGDDKGKTKKSTGQEPLNPDAALPPADWDGTSDWSGSVFTIVEETL